MRFIFTVVAVLVGAVFGAFIGSFGLYYLCIFIDWLRDAGPGNQIMGGAWALLIITVPGGALMVGAIFGVVTWTRLSDDNSEADSSPVQKQQPGPELDRNSIDGFYSETEDRNGSPGDD